MQNILKIPNPLTEITTFGIGELINIAFAKLENVSKTNYVFIHTLINRTSYKLVKYADLFSDIFNVSYIYRRAFFKESSDADEDDTAISYPYQNY